MIYGCVVLPIRTMARKRGPKQKGKRGNGGSSFDRWQNSRKNDHGGDLDERPNTCILSSRGSDARGFGSSMKDWRWVSPTGSCHKWISNHLRQYQRSTVCSFDRVVGIVHR